MKQKLDYIHDNPCRGKWNLVADVTKYVHSSAKFYLCGEQGVYPVMSYLELADIDLTKPASEWRRVQAKHKATLWDIGCEVCVTDTARKKKIYLFKMSCFFERKNEPSNFTEIANLLFRHLNVLRENRLIDFDMVNIESLYFKISTDQLNDSGRERELAEVLLKDKLKDIRRYHKIKNPTLDFKEAVGVTMMIKFLEQREKVSYLMVSMGGEKETFLFTGFPGFKNDSSKYFNFFYNQIEYLNPVYGYIDAAMISSKQHLPEFFFGWMSFFSNVINLPPIPDDYEIEELPGKGKIIITTREFFDPKNNIEHYNKAMKLVELFKEYNIVRPEI